MKWHVHGGWSVVLLYNEAEACYKSIIISRMYSLAHIFENLRLIESKRIFHKRECQLIIIVKISGFARAIMSSVSKSRFGSCARAHERGAETYEAVSQVARTREMASAHHVLAVVEIACAAARHTHHR